jgi:serine/threonine protein kinase
MVPVSTLPLNMIQDPGDLIPHIQSLHVTQLQEKVSADEFITIKALGEGAHGFVRLCHHKNDSNKNPVVVKYVLRNRIDQWCRCAGYDRRIPYEVAILHDIGYHPNIIRFLSFFQDDFFVCIVTEYQEAVDLFEYIEREELKELQIRGIFHQALLAVQHIHSLGIVHRDIKDENFLIDKLGRVTLIDFGSAQYVRNGPFLHYAGTSLYQPPEVLQGNAYGGTEQDMWQMGILLHILMFKRNPFENNEEIRNCVLSLQNGYSASLKDLLHGLLTLDVSKRLTAQEALEHPWFTEARR